MFSRSVLSFNPAAEADRISGFIRDMVFGRFKRKGAVIGLSGGIDSAVVSELCARALGKERVLGLFLPEKESNPVSLQYAQDHAAKMGIEALTVDITEHLDSFKVYERRNAVIKGIFPEFDDSWRFHITLPQDLLEKDRINYHTIIAEDKAGVRRQARISGSDWLAISACQNMKQRTRMMQMYYCAERQNYIVAGTTNRPELMQGFYVKYGDGGVDIEPIAHLYKTQVFSLARHLGVIEAIVQRSPSPDTYSLPVTDKEFYFCMDYEMLDILLYAYEHGTAMEDVSKETGLGTEQIKRAFRDFAAKDRATWHLRQLPPSLDNT
jgi:NAD+ synthase